MRRQSREAAAARREDRNKTTQVRAVSIQPDAIAHRSDVILGEASGGTTLAFFCAIFRGRNQGISDPMHKQMQQIMFAKNASMLGATLLLMYFGAGLRRAVVEQEILKIGGA